MWLLFLYAFVLVFLIAHEKLYNRRGRERENKRERGNGWKATEEESGGKNEDPRLFSPALRALRMYKRVCEQTKNQEKKKGNGGAETQRTVAERETVEVVENEGSQGREERGGRQEKNKPTNTR